MYNYHIGWNLSTKSLSSPSYWFYLLNPFISLFMCWWNWSLLFEDFDWRLSQFPQSYFFSQLVFSLLILFTCYLCCMYVSFHHDDYTTILLCMHPSTLFVACISSPRKFLKQYFLSDEFVKIAYSPPLVDITHFQLVWEQGTPLFCVILV